MKKSALLVTLLCLLIGMHGRAQQVASYYTFSQSSGLYSNITGGTVAASGTGLDNQRYSVSLPFDFNINGTVYSSVYICVNGFLAFGSDPGSGVTWALNSSSSGFSVAAGFAMDLASRSSNSEIRYQTLGSSPTRTFVVQWKDFAYSGSTTALKTNFQIQLEEGTNKIYTVYDTVDVSGSSFFDVQTGIRGSTNTYVTARSGSWSSSSGSTSNTAVLTTTASNEPAIGLEFTYSPPLCTAPANHPSGLTLTPDFTSMAVSFTAASPAPTGYLVVRTTNATLSATPADRTTYNSGNTIGNGIVVYNGTSTSFTNSSLSMNTNYRYTVFPYNTGICINTPMYKTASAITADATTLKPQAYTWQPTTGSASWNTASNWSPARVKPHANDTLLFTNGGTVTATDVLNTTFKILGITNNTHVTLKGSAANTLTITDSLRIDAGSSLILGSGSPLTFQLNTTNKVTQVNGSLVLQSKSNFRAGGDSVAFNGDVVLEDTSKLFLLSGTKTSFNDTFLLRHRSTYDATSGNSTFRNAIKLTGSGKLTASISTGTNVRFDTSAVVYMLDTGKIEGSFPMMVQCTVNVSGSGAAITNNATSFAAGAVYNHLRDGGSIPSATYHSESLINITGIVNGTVSVPYSCGDVIWNCTGQTADISINGMNVKGDFTLVTTNNKKLRPAFLEVQDTFLQQSGTLQLYSSPSQSFESYVTCNGEALLSGGILDLNGASQNNYIFRIKRNLYQAVGHTITKSGQGQSKGILEFSGTQKQTISFSGTLVDTVAIGYTLNNGNGAILTGILPVKRGATNLLLNGYWSGTGKFSYDNNSTLQYTSATPRYATDIEWPAVNDPGIVWIYMTDLTYPNYTFYLQGHRDIIIRLTLQRGIVDIGDYELKIHSADPAALEYGTYYYDPGDPEDYSTVRMIACGAKGHLVRNVGASPQAKSFLYPIGELINAPQYSPVKLNLAAGTGNRYISVGVQQARHPNSSAANSTLNRYWTFKDGGSTPFRYTAQFYYPATDDVPGPYKSLQCWNGSAWSYVSNTIQNYGNIAGHSYASIIDTLSTSATSLNNSVFTLRPIANTTYNWTGAVSKDFQVAGNWSPARTSPHIGDILVFNSGNNDTALNIPQQTIAALKVTNFTTAHLQGGTGAGLYQNELTLLSDHNTATNELAVDSGSAMYVDGDVKGLSINLKNDSCRTRIAGTLDLKGFSKLNSVANECTGCLATVPSSGKLIVSGAVNSYFNCSDTNRLLIQGVYEDKHSTNEIWFPRARWANGSKTIISGLTTVTSITGLQGSLFSLDVNCPSLTANVVVSPSSVYVRDTLRLVSTGTGSFAWYGDVNHYKQTGGNLKVNYMNMYGSFVQSGGSVSMYNSGYEGRLNFKGRSGTQYVSFKDTAPAGVMHYTVENPDGIELVGTGNLTTNFDLTDLTINTSAGRPVNTTLKLRYGSNSTLNYLQSSVMDSTVFPSVNGPAMLNINIWNGGKVVMPFSRTLPDGIYQLTGRLDIGAHHLTLGTSANSRRSFIGGGGSTNDWKDNGIELSTGSVTTWMGIYDVPTSTFHDYYQNIPLCYRGQRRDVAIYYNSSTAIKSAGTITYSYAQAPGITSGLSVSDNGYMINKRTNSSWIITTGNGFAMDTTKRAILRVSSTGMFTADTPQHLRLMKAGSVAGWHEYGSGPAPAYVAVRSYLKQSELTDTFYIGTSDTNMKVQPSGWIVSVGTGKWNRASTWDKNRLPVAGDTVVISPTDTVTVDSSAFASTVYVRSYGVLKMSDSILKVGDYVENKAGSVLVQGGRLVLGPQGGGKRTFYNDGLLKITSGKLIVNGNLEMKNTLGGRWEQTGGDIVVDGNAGGILSVSVPESTPLAKIEMGNNDVAVTGGNFIIVDPHAGTNAQNAAVLWSPENTYWRFGEAHNFILGDGQSTTPGGSSAGFNVVSNTKSGYEKRFGNVIIKGSLSGDNRRVTAAQRLCVAGNLHLQGVNAVMSNSNVAVNGNVTADSGALMEQTSLTFDLATSVSTDFPSNNAQTLSGKGKFMLDATTPGFASLTINNSSPQGVKFEMGSFETQVLHLKEGKLTIPDTAVITHATVGGGYYDAAVAGWVCGGTMVRRIYPSTGSSVIFRIGDSLSAHLVTISNSSVLQAGGIKVKLIKTDHPNISTSIINSAKSINRYYQIDTLGNLKLANAKLSLSWPAHAEDSAFGWPHIVIGNYNNGTWTHMSPKPPASKSVTVDSLTTGQIDGSFQVGEIGSAPQISQQPVAAATCVGGITNFNVKAAYATAYLWQVNKGSSWTNVSNDSIHTGAYTSELTISSVAASMNGYQYRCRVYNIYDSTTSNAVALTTAISVTPTVEITSDKGFSICSSWNTTFTANVRNGGLMPAVEWTRNGVLAASGTYTYSPSSLTNGDVIICKLVSNLSCADTTPVYDTVTMSVTQTITSPSVAIGISPNDSVCVGTSATFTATPTNGGSNPKYQWLVNGATIPVTTSTFSSGSMTGVNTIACYLVNTDQCVYSNTAQTSRSFAVLQPDSLRIKISYASSLTLCSTNSLTFRMDRLSGYGMMTVAWKKNGVAVGTGNSTYFASNLAHNDLITCTVTSAGPCQANTTAVDSVRVTVWPTVTPSVTITNNTGNHVCTGTPVTFTATAVNAGRFPTYTWKKNNNIIGGGGSNIYTDSNFVTGDVITCQVASTAPCRTTTNATSNSITMTVGTTAPPTINISLSPNDTICAGTAVTFSAAVTNAGSSPTYQWKINGSNVGTNSATYTSSALSNNDTVSCVLTSSLSCASPTMDTSNVIVMTVNPINNPDVTLAVSPNDTVCAGTSVTFTATPTNGGTSPQYQWRINGSNTGGNSTTLTRSNLANGDVVSCILTSSIVCSSKDTASMPMTIVPLVTPAVSISVSPNDTICSGTSTTFTATVTNGGTNPSYQWKVGTGNVGTNSNTYTTSTLANNNTVTCVLTSNAMCASPATVTSTGITMKVNTTVTPTITISSGSGTTICAGTSVTYTATTTNGGTSPSYQWKVNGSNVGTNASTFTTNSLVHGDVVTCVLSSSVICPSSTAVTSNSIAMTVNPMVTPDVTISVSPNDTICVGNYAGFTATPVNGGSFPSYRWFKNGVSVTTSSTYGSTAFSNGDVITCVLTSSATCRTKNTDTSSGITMTVQSMITPDVTVAVSPNDTICSGTLVTFTATPINGGTAPTYIWLLNGSTALGSGSACSTAALANGDVITCHMASNASCITSTSVGSTPLTMKVNPVLIPTITVTRTPSNAICAGTSVTFNASIGNGGTAPVYQWKLNGSNVGSNSSSYTNATLNNNDTVICELTSNATCASPTEAESIPHIMTVIPVVTPSVTIAANPGVNVGPFRPVTFTATVTNGGPSPTYQWQKNASNIPGATFPTYTGVNEVDFLSGDTLSVAVTSSEFCAQPATVTSNELVMITNLQVDDVRMTDDLKMVPNPTDGRFTISGTVHMVQANSSIQLGVYSMQGQLLHTQEIQVKNNRFSSEVMLPGNMANGTYLLRIGQGSYRHEITFNLIRR